MIELAQVQRVAEQARLAYEAWKVANPSLDPVLDPYADAVWGLERAAARLVAVLKHMGPQAPAPIEAGDDEATEPAKKRRKK